MDIKSFLQLFLNREARIVPVRLDRKSNCLRVEMLEDRCLLSTAIDADPGNHPFWACQLNLDDDTTYEQEISAFNDRDYYVVTPEYSGLMTVDMEASEGSGLDTVLFAYNSRYRLMDYSLDYSVSTTDSQVQFYVEAGQNYYLLAFGQKWSTGDYTLVIDQPDADSPVWEKNDYSNSLVRATVIEIESSSVSTIEVDAGIYPANDIDCFSFTAPTDGRYTVSMTTQDSPLDSYLFLFNSRYRLVDRNDDVSSRNTDSQIVFEAEAGETFYILADGWRYSSGTYTLSIDMPYDSSNSQQDTNGGSGDGSGESIVSDETDVWVLAVGAYDYSGVMNDLAGPQADMDIVTSMMTDYYGVSSDHINIIAGSSEEVNAGSLEAGVQWLADNADADDIAMFYYSGHGEAGISTVLDDNESLFLPDGSHIYQSTLDSWFGQINEETSKILIIDSCYSGGFVSLADSLSNTAVISTCDFDQTAWDEVPGFYPASGSSRGGIFANWLSYGVRSGAADTNNDNRVSFLEAFSYADFNINIVTGTGFSNQDPQINSLIDLDSLLSVG